MTNVGLSKFTTAFGLSLAVTSVISALLVVAKELSPSLMASLKRLTGQHWVSHSVIAVVLFLALGWLFSRGAGVQISSQRLLFALVGGVILGGLIISGFYLLGG